MKGGARMAAKADSDIRIVARSVVARVLTGARYEVGELWESYPLVGEYDWDRVVQEVEKIREDIDVSAKVSAEAYDRLGLRGD